ncbi:MAG TPA: histidine kinase dimerization/phospho-acceptor domain-containing protein, partial [Sedimentisphaerales bacterium]|nr:histidine kinase dimerization/phospho-acceptor domain-containing protein [Sedimentisphaerales bacterium]
ERLAAVGYVGATMAHEVNTPLSVMRLTTQMLMAELEKTGNRKTSIEKTEVILREIDRVSEIIRRYRELSRPAREISDSDDEILAVPEQIVRAFKGAAEKSKLRIAIGEEVPELLVRLGSVNDAEQLMFVLVQKPYRRQTAEEGEHSISPGRCSITMWSCGFRTIAAA